MYIYECIKDFITTDEEEEQEEEEPERKIILIKVWPLMAVGCRPIPSRG